MFTLIKPYNYEVKPFRQQIPPPQTLLRHLLDYHFLFLAVLELMTLHYLILHPERNPLDCHVPRY